MSFQVRIKSPTDKSLDRSISVSAQQTIKSVKEMLATELGVEEERIRLIYNSTILADVRTVDQCGIRANVTVHISVKKAPAAVSQTAPAARSSGQAPQPTQKSEVDDPLPPRSQNPVAAPQPQPAGAPAASAYPNMGSLFQHPQQFQQLINSNPMMQSLMQNKDLMRSMLINNPMIEELCKSNPMMREALQNPETVDMMIDMMSDPQKMKDAMRETDTAITNLQSVPGGMEMLHKLQADIERIQNNMSGLRDGEDRPDIFGVEDGSRHGSSQPASSTAANPFGSLDYQSFMGYLRDNPSAYSNNIFASMLQNPIYTNQQNSEFELPGFPMSYTMSLRRRNEDARAPEASASAPTSRPAANPFGQPGTSPFGPGTPSMEEVREMMRNPMFKQALNQILDNPEEFKRQMSNPMVKSMMQQQYGNNPLMNSMLENPDLMISQLRAAMTMMDTFDDGAPVTSGPAAPDGGHPRAHSVFSSSIPARERYASQLEQVHQMGFYDRDDEVLRLLEMYNGNVERVLNHLLGN